MQEDFSVEFYVQTTWMHKTFERVFHMQAPNSFVIVDSNELKFAIQDSHAWLQFANAKSFGIFDS
jgi:hypothetical protein